MSYKLGIRNLGRDILDNKQIAPFLGAGVNHSKEVSSIADNVIAIRRNEKDIYRVEFNIERRLKEHIPSRIVRLDIQDILHLFRCDNRNMHIAFSTEDDRIRTRIRIRIKS